MSTSDILTFGTPSNYDTTHQLRENKAITNSRILSKLEYAISSIFMVFETLAFEVNFVFFINILLYSI